MPDAARTDANAEVRRRLVAGLRGKGAHLTFDEAVRDFPRSLFNARPDNVPYTFWHQLEHMRIGQWDVLRYVIDKEHVSPSWPTGYWPDVAAKASDREWKRTIEHYHADLEELVSLVERDDVDLLAPVAHNAGRSIMGSAMIVIDHAAYHLGEFVMGRQILGAWKSALA